MERELPFDITAGTTVDLKCTLETFHASTFESQIHIYLDDLGLREQIMIVQGTAVARSSPGK